MKRALRFFGMVVVVLFVLAGSAFAWLSLRSPDMRPASTETVERTPERIERGRYLAHHVTGCIECHSQHVEDRFSRPTKPGTLGGGGVVVDERYGFPGSTCPQNLTPDPETGLGQWTDGEVLRAIREGVSKDGTALFPMMPYESFHAISDEDARSIVAYLRTLPAIKNQTLATRIKFPVNLFIKFAPKPLTGPVEMPDDAKDAKSHLEYGRYLARIAGCADCHTPHDSHQQPIEAKAYSGGWVMKGPWGTIITPNITPHADTFVGKVTKEAFIARFTSYAGYTAETAPVAEPGRNSVMPWMAYSKMTEKDLGAIYDHLKSMPAIENKVDPYAEQTVSK